MSVETDPRPAPGERHGLFIRFRAYLSLSRVQATLGILAALLSIGGALYGYLRPGRAVVPDHGAVVAIVHEGKSGKPVADATVELLTLKDALVTSVPLTGGEGRRELKEGVYRLRVTHPKYTTEVREIQVVAGQTNEIRLKLAPRPPAAPPPGTADKALEELKKIFR
jgi:hypothetical protein